VETILKILLYKNLKNVILSEIIDKIFEFRGNVVVIIYNKTCLHQEKVLSYSS
jgi:hypothetical protein